MSKNKSKNKEGQKADQLGCTLTRILLIRNPNIIGI